MKTISEVVEYLKERERNLVDMKKETRKDYGTNNFIYCAYDAQHEEIISILDFINENED